MTIAGEVEAGFMAVQGNDAFSGVQEGAPARLMFREDGSVVDSAVDDSLLEALGLSDERLAKLRRLKAEIAGGRYFVSASDVAERLMDSMLVH